MKDWLRRSRAALVHSWRTLRIRAAGRVKAPTILQMEAVECGAASLAMVLAYHGRWVPIEQLRAACGISRDGSKASSILRAARAYGLVAKGYRKDIGDLTDLPCPLILHWNFNHFLVLEGVRGDKAWLNDPMSGPRQASMVELEEAFTGVVLTCVPGPDFIKSGRRPPLFKLLMARLAGSRPAVAMILGSSLALVIPAITIPAFARIFVDGILVNQQEGWFAPLMIGMVLTAFLRAGLTWLQQSLLVRLESKIAVVGATRFMLHLLSLPIGFFTQRHPGEIANRVAANDAAAKLLSGDIATTSLNLATALLLALVMLSYDPVLASAAIALTLPNIPLLRAVRHWQQQASRRQVTERGKLGAAAVGAIQNIETLKASGLEDHAFQRIAGFQANLLNIESQLGVQGALISAAPALLKGISTALVLGLGAHRVMEGALTLGALVAFQSLAESFAAPIGQFVGLSATLQTVLADINRVEDAMGNPADPLTRYRHPEAGAPMAGYLSLSGISFGYSPLEPPLISNLDLSLAPGRRVALVGGSGSGKSTIGRLVCGLLHPQSGQILFDGRPIDSLDPAERASIIAYVDQDSFLFEGSIRDNLTLWDPLVPDQVLIRALEDAAILDDIASRAGQIDAMVDEAGSNFSGGQRQRLEIARALVGDPRILVLDEATAALDPATEKQIDDGLRRRGCTCVIIAHRLSTIRDCDEIIVLKQGRVVERGTHDALLRDRGEYASLLATQ